MLIVVGRTLRYRLSHTSHLDLDMYNNPLQHFGLAVIELRRIKKASSGYRDRYSTYSTVQDMIQFYDQLSYGYRLQYPPTPTWQCAVEDADATYQICHCSYRPRQRSANVAFGHGQASLRYCGPFVHTGCPARATPGKFVGGCEHGVWRRPGPWKKRCARSSQLQPPRP